MKKKPAIDRKTLPTEITQLEGLSVQVNAAQMAETINCIAYDLANKHSVREVMKWLRLFRGKKEGFWRKK